MKTNELTGAALDWAATKADGFHDQMGDARHFIRGGYSTNWSEGGPIIEREGMQLWKGGTWCASLDQSFNPPEFETGETPLIAAMRCYVASKLGDEVEIPEELK